MLYESSPRYCNAGLTFGGGGGGGAAPAGAPPGRGGAAMIREGLV